MPKKKTKRIKGFSESQMEYSRDLTHWYHKYNRLYFKDRLLPNIEVYYAPMPSAKGTFRYGVTGISKCNRAMYIALNNKLKMLGQDISLITLLHEMVHSAFPQDCNHGKKFKKETRRLLLAGAYDDLLG
jgi:predicted metal-dependent hydrolase